MSGSIPNDPGPGGLGISVVSDGTTTLSGVRQILLSGLATVSSAGAGTGIADINIGSGTTKGDVNISGTLTIGSPPHAGSVLTTNGVTYQVATNTQPTTDFTYNTFMNTVSYTSDGTGGDSLGVVSYMAVRPNGHTVGAGASQHTAAIYGNGYLDNDGNAASTIAWVNGGMFVVGNAGPGTIQNAAAVLIHPNYNVGSGTFGISYGIFEIPSTAAQHHYNYLSAPLGIGTTAPTYNLDINATAGGNVSATNWARIGNSTGQFLLGSGGASFFPGYNPGAGGLGVTDLVVGNAGNQNPTTATTNFFFLNSCAGTPTGVPLQAAAGRIPMLFDTTTNKLWAYINGAWKASAAFA